MPMCNHATSCWCRAGQVTIMRLAINRPVASIARCSRSPPRARPLPRAALPRAALPRAALPGPPCPGPPCPGPPCPGPPCPGPPCPAPGRPAPGRPAPGRPAPGRPVPVRWTGYAFRATIGCSASIGRSAVAPSRPGLLDVRGNSRTMRLSWYAETGVAVFSIWRARPAPAPSGYRSPTSPGLSKHCSGALQARPPDTRTFRARGLGRFKTTAQ